MRLNFRFIIALVIAAVTLFGYFFNTSTNPVTGEKQHVNMTAAQEIALGVQAAPEMEQQYGGESADPRATAAVQQVGQQIVKANGLDQKTEYRYQFHLLADDQTINAFALPGGQVFITQGLLKNLTTEAQLAGVLAHEVGHVVGRHSAEQVAQSQLTQGLTGAAAIASYDPNNPGSSVARAAAAAMIAKLVTLRYGRNDELEADDFAVKLTPRAGYDPSAMINVMQMLDRQGGGSRQPEFLSTHPNPGNRIEELQKDIQQQFPQGVPAGLKK
ncbi:M48 family metalloprotease [Hymenobacter sp. HMF4947]|uniref:M48 family metalloprotease n=1 Tax=Hymenobacter ginkgonis TaxID=2682976 RepID=A0A7K1TBR1_9BACT|nr:M48 family metallopeptidase [Hymenobacter ginkgonis]MVN75813.1 M48 family metalloprotease [Hymenobacter ginkgonis]